MIAFPHLSDQLEQAAEETDYSAAASKMLAIGEQVLENWIESREQVPTEGTKEGFRLLALHRQGAKGEPSFNACRETCRELVYHYNVIQADPGGDNMAKTALMMNLVTNHLLLFVSGKMQVEKLGEFCCASKPIRNEAQSSQVEIIGV